MHTHQRTLPHLPVSVPLGPERHLLITRDLQTPPPAQAGKRVGYHKCFILSLRGELARSPLTMCVRACVRAHERLEGRRLLAGSLSWSWCLCLFLAGVRSPVNRRFC